MSEKACIFNIQKFSIHDGPGIRSVVFFKGCPLRCYWCANPESQSGEPELMWDNQQKKKITVGEYKTVDDIVEEVMKDEPFYEESGGGVTLSGGEVLYQADFAIDLLKALREKNIHTACETTGYANPNVFKRFMEQVDLIYYDVKHYDSKKHLEGIGVPNTVILDNLQTAIANHPAVIVRIPVIPSYNDSLEDARQFAELFKKIGVQQVELLPFHQFGEKKYDYLDREYCMHDIPQMHSEDLVDFSDILTAAGIQCVIR
ncbi:glycyl-radical enzyme activating protein [Vagococcus acidifermentans]|uniref:Pyruvate formate lyase-activating protein n=1 Tax=Vagococcus acidifermentans TaxID=564710 RepID=A0A430AZE1_9ENTE|nr:glycyl-radical enzyme activating protein [Vagococcus acidifermentans]RSU13431.1 pyruvate formate lyase-activating protein [Vagococcus acidifermentans]